MRLMVTLTRGVCRAIPRFFAIALAEVTTPLANETWPAFVLVREDEDRIAFGDVLAAIHRLLRAERECLCPRVADLGFDGENHAPINDARGSGKAVAPGDGPIGRSARPLGTGRSCGSA